MESKELICLRKVVIMLEMLRNWGEPAMSALDIYQIIGTRISHSHQNTSTKKEAETMHFTFIKVKGICREHDKCRKYNRKQVF